MIVQHTDKECKTKFSIGVEFKNSLYEKLTIWEKILAFFKNLFYNIATWIRNLIGGDEV